MLFSRSQGTLDMVVFWKDVAAKVSFFIKVADESSTLMNAGT